MVVVIRISFRVVLGVKVDSLEALEGSSPGRGDSGNANHFRTVGEQDTKPGSKSGACTHRGNLGTWERVAADKAAIQRVKVPSCQLLDTGT